MYVVVEAMRRRRALTIGGSDSSGGAGVQADLKTFAALGVYGASVITVLTAQNSRGVHAVHEEPVEIVEAQLAAIMDDPGLAADYAKTSMLYSPAIIETVAAAISHYRIPFVLDPVMTAGSGGMLLEEEALHTLVKELVPRCAVITPNVPEARALSGVEKIRTMNDVQAAARAIHQLGAPAVIIKGGHLEDERAAGWATDVLYDGEFALLRFPLVQTERVVHGGGCSFSAALAAELARDRPLHEAAAAAKRFVHHAIAGGTEIGTMLVVDQLQHIRTDADRYAVLSNVTAAVRILSSLDGFAEVLPEVGTNIGMAIADARNEQDIAAVDGRIIRTKDGFRAGCVAFGASDHVARLILAMMEQDSACRSAINLRYTPAILKTCSLLGMPISSFDRANEPAAEKTMAWGVREASSAFVPEVIYDLGAVGKEPMVRIFGSTAVEVAEKVKRIVEALK
jgi:hydroxymethylpyrimidine kinase/phosphomethylpyrimidine kinase